MKTLAPFPDSILPLGWGGAFDHVEGNSSFYLPNWLGLGNCLIDCGSTVYGKLKEKDLVKDIDYVFITHTHDDHIGSLSALIYDRWFIHKKETIVVTTVEVEYVLYAYLTTICGHNKEQFHIGHPSQLGLDTVRTIATDNMHTLGMHSCGFFFRGTDFNLVYSGDIAVPILGFKELTDILKTESLPNVILHDTTKLEYPGNVHCNYKFLKAYEKDYIIYGYHHNKADAIEIQLNSNIKSIACV